MRRRGALSKAPDDGVPVVCGRGADLGEDVEG